ncbi:MAG: type II toxin-antitoxin system HipA family toxin [Hyphomicrobium sp.]|nr:type II toxin-antitoxin system HipA family toxin [Hyphomicrobium sp.]PPC80017.1 MAG: phosphatidylinositol kinase [Hyphomicrobium sp.]
MKHRPATLLNVFLDGRQRRKLGRLAAQGRRILFEYDPTFLATGLQISPFKLPTRSGVMIDDDQVFDGLFGVFNDSLPDGWGRLLLDRAVERLGITRQELTPLDRLAHVGQHGMGALSYEPDLSDSDRAPVVLELDAIARDAATVLKGEEGAVIEKLLKLNGASAGARPKVVAQVSADKKRIIHGPAMLPAGYAHWMIKFPSAQDDAAAGATEYAYSLMARAAGVAMPETHLFTAKKKRYFGIKRFDRDSDRRIHMHSLSGLLHADHRVSSLDYDALLKATQILTKDATEVERAFRLACFNVLARNRDDHAKNVSFLLDDSTGQWTLAPAYDLTFSSGPGGEQSMTVMGEGRAPDAGHLSALAKKHDMKNGAAILAEVQAAVADWSQHADAAGLTKAAAKLIGDRIAPQATKVAKTKAKAEPKPKVKAEAKPKAKGAAVAKAPAEPRAKPRKGGH